MTDQPYEISAKDYRDLISIMFGPSAKKKNICRMLGISRPTHNVWTMRGVRSQDRALDLRDRVGVHLTDLRQRARALDKWTTSNNIKPPAKRLTYQPDN